MSYYQFTNTDDPNSEPYGCCEVFYLSEADVKDAWQSGDAERLAMLNAAESRLWPEEDDEPTVIFPRYLAGWYWQACFPGCLPDGEPVGPFETEEEACADAGVAP